MCWPFARHIDRLASGCLCKVADALSVRRWVLCRSVSSFACMMMWQMVLDLSMRMHSTSATISSIQTPSSSSGPTPQLQFLDSATGCFDMICVVRHGISKRAG